MPASASAPAPSHPSSITSTFRALMVLRKTKASGELSLCNNGVTTRVYVLRGQPVFADGGELLGRRLHRTGVITLGEYIAVANALSEQPGGHSDQAFAEGMVRHGVLSIEQAYAALRDLVCERIVRCLANAQQSWHFAPKAPSDLDLRDYGTPVESLFLKAARAFDPRRTERVLELHEDRYPKLLEAVETIAASFAISTAEAKFLQGIDGTRSTHALLAAPLTDGSDGAAILAAVLLAGAAELRPYPMSLRFGAALPPPRSTAPESASTGSSVRLSSHTPSVPSLRERDEALLKSFRASVVPPFKMPAIDLAAHVPAAAQIRPSALTSPEAVAERALEKAKAHFRRFAFRGAIPDLKIAASLFPENLTYATYLTWAQVRSGEAEVSQKKLKTLAVQATCADAGFAFGYYVLGHLALSEGEEQVAWDFFCHAMALEEDTSDPEALVASVGPGPDEADDYTGPASSIQWRGPKDLVTQDVARSGVAENDISPTKAIARVS